MSAIWVNSTSKIVAARQFTTSSASALDGKPQNSKHTDSSTKSGQIESSTWSDADTTKSSKEWREDVENHARNAEGSSSFSGYGSASRTKEETEHTGEKGQQDPDRANK
ncbi:hypothetical protein OIV83_003382 [Microbotryomycetes sp. JL201]|nr:hypothetical protein OIV83_003382 [Microbotryomycetes sp. JL201]